jgi:uncharacterized membrane protein
MGGGKLKWFLGASLAVNLFLIAGVVAGVMVIHHHVQEWQQHHGQGPGQAWSDVEAKLKPEESAHIRQLVKSAALQTEPDMDKARSLRKQAETLAAQDPYDAAKVVDLAEQARSYENMSRARVETALIQDLAHLPADQRKVVAGFVLRPGFRLRRLLGPMPGHKDQPDAGQSAAQSQDAH